MQADKEEVLWRNITLLCIIIGSAYLVYLVFKNTGTGKSTGGTGPASTVRGTESVVLPLGTDSGLAVPRVSPAAVPTGGTGGAGGQ